MGAAPRVLQLIDGTIVRRRRVSLGLSCRALAGMLGVTQMVINRLEHGMRQNELDVSFIVDLATALGVDPAQLLHSGPPAARPVDAPDPDAPDPDVTTPDDTRNVGAVLAGAGGWVFVDDLADGLGWTLERTLLALDSLGEQAFAVGQRLAWLSDREVRLAEDLASDVALRKVTGRAITSWGLMKEEAVTLFRLANGSRDPRHRSTLTASRRLVAADLIEVDPVAGGRKDDEPRLSDTARYNLCLDELGITGERTFPSQQVRTRAKALDQTTRTTGG